MMRVFAERAVECLSWGFTFLLCLVLTVFMLYLLLKGLPSLGAELVFGKADPLGAVVGRERVFEGIFPAIIGTFCLVILSTLVALPLGIGSGIYLSEYATPGMKKIVGGLFDVLAGIPSIVVGLCGFSVAIFLHHHFSDRLGPCLLISAFSLGVLVLPYIVRSTQTSLEELPAHIRTTATALGATRLQNVVYVLIPNALGGISSGVILAIGRCAEDTAVILLTGVVATAGVPSSLLSQYEALPFYISQLRRKVAMIFQEPNPLPMSIGKNMAFPLKLAGVRDKYVVEEKVRTALKQAFLWEEVKDRLGESALNLSGGQKQRLCIARALVLKPEVLLCDEPTSSLDAKAAGIIEELLTGLTKSCTLLVVSHYLEQVQRIGDQVMILEKEGLTHFGERSSC